MSWTASQPHHRTGIVLNYIALVLLALSIMAIEYGWATSWPVAVLIVGLILFVLTFIRVYGRTGLWRFVHLPLERFDEREIQVIHRALRVAYTIFTILALLYILVLTLGIQFFAGLTDPEGDFSLGSVIFAAFIYLSHILPASIIAWSERDVLL